MHYWDSRAVTFSFSVRTSQPGFVFINYCWIGLILINWYVTGNTWLDSVTIRLITFCHVVSKYMGNWKEIVRNMFFSLLMNIFLFLVHPPPQSEIVENIQTKLLFSWFMFSCMKHSLVYEGVFVLLVHCL